MIHANITLKEIHYEKSFANLFPMGMERCRKQSEPVLEEKGLCVKLEDFVFVQEAASGAQDEAVVENAKERKYELSPALEEELLGAVAGYLKMLLKE